MRSRGRTDLSYYAATRSQIEAVESKLRGFRRDAACRDVGIVHVFAEIERVLVKLLAVLPLQDSDCCRLVVKIISADSLETLADRVTDLQLQVEQMHARMAVRSVSSCVGADEVKEAIVSRSSGSAFAQGRARPIVGSDRHRLHL